MLNEIEEDRRDLENANAVFEHTRGSESLTTSSVVIDAN